jgi:hypothetical protein
MKKAAQTVVRETRRPVSCFVCGAAGAFRNGRLYGGRRGIHCVWDSRPCRGRQRPARAFRLTAYEGDVHKSRAKRELTELAVSVLPKTAWAILIRRSWSLARSSACPRRGRTVRLVRPPGCARGFAQAVRRRCQCVRAAFAARADCFGLSFRKRAGAGCSKAP